MLKRNFLTVALFAGLLASNLPDARAASYNLTVSKNPAHLADYDSLQDAFALLVDGDVATITILDSAVYNTTADLMDGFDNGTVHLKVAVGQFPSIAPQGDFDVFELDNNVGGTQLGDVDGGRIRIVIDSPVGEPGNRIFMIRNDNTTPVVIQNFLVKYQNVSPGGGIVVYNNQNSDPASAAAPRNEIEFENVVFDCGGLIRDGWRRHNVANVSWTRVQMKDCFRYPFWGRHDTGDPRDSCQIDLNLTDWRSTADNAWRNQNLGGLNVVWNINRTLFISKGSASAVVLQQEPTHEINFRRTGIIYDGPDAAVPGFSESALGDSLGAGYTFDHCDIYVSGTCMDLNEVNNRPINVSNSNLAPYNAGLGYNGTAGVSGNYNNVFTTDVDALADGSVYGPVTPGASDVIPGQDPQYGLSVKFGNFTYSNTFLKTADNLGGPIGIDDNLSDVIGYVVPNQVKYWNLY